MKLSARPEDGEAFDMWCKTIIDNEVIVELDGVNITHDHLVSAEEGSGDLGHVIMVKLNKDGCYCLDKDNNIALEKRMGNVKITLKERNRSGNPYGFYW